MERDMPFLCDLLENIANASLSVADRDILCLQAKNFLRPRSVEHKLALFEKYQKIPKTQRGQYLQFVYNQVEELNYAYLVFAALLEQDACQSKSICLHKSFIQMLLENPTPNSIRCLKILFESCSYQTSQEIIIKQRSFVPTLFRIAQQVEARLIPTLVAIFPRVIQNCIAQAADIMDFAVQLLQNQVQNTQEECVIILFQTLIELDKVKHPLVLQSIDKILEVANQYFDQYFKHQESSTIVINIVQFFKQIDECNYKNNEFLMESAIMPLVQHNVPDYDLRAELFECIQQFSRHYYIISSQSEKINYFGQILDQISASNLFFIAAAQPLWRHTEIQGRLSALNGEILSNFNPMIISRNIALFPYQDVIDFCVYLNNFTIFSPKEQFIQFALGIKESIILFINFLEGFSAEFFSLFNNFISKLFICGYADLSGTVNELVGMLLVKLSMLVAQNDPQASKLLSFATVLNISKFLFASKNNIFIEQEKFTKEYLSFKSGDIANRKTYTERLALETTELDLSYAVIESLKTVSGLSILVFKLLENIKTKSAQNFIQLHQIALTLLCNAVCAMSEKQMGSNLFDPSVQQFCSLQVLIDSILPKMAELYSLYMQDFAVYQDCSYIVLDTISGLSQLCEMQEKDFTVELQKYPIILESILCEQGMLTLVDTEVFCHATTLLSVLVPMADQNMISTFTSQCLSILSRDDIPSESRSSQQYLLSQLILYRSISNEQILFFMKTAALILQQSESSTSANNLLISTLSLANCFYNFHRQQQCIPDQSGDTNMAIFDGLFNYIRQIQFESVFELDQIELLLECFIGLMGTEKQPRNIVAKPLISLIIKKCIGILSGVQGDQVAEVVLQGFMGDYNKVLQGLDVMKSK